MHTFETRQAFDSYDSGMNELPVDLYHAAQVRELDRVAIEDFEIPGYELMQRAGRAAFDILHTRWPQAHQIQVLAGAGNNGGDGFVIARLALEAGLDVWAVQLGDPTRIRGDALEARDAYLQAGGKVQPYGGGALAACDVIVDALLGTGLEREVKADWQAAIEAINAHVAPVLAVDIPSGLHSDTGVPLGVAVRASCTVTFIGLKQGLFTGHAPEHAGEVYFNALRVPADVYAGLHPSAQRIDANQYAALLAPRSRISHKGHFGHVLVVGGDEGMSGAARMAAEAAARTGAGLVSVATRSSHAALLNVTCPVLMVHAVESPVELEPLLERATVIALGPGLGQSHWAEALLQKVLAADKPMVVDADGLNLLARVPVRRDDWILTPHPGEAARLLETDTGTIQNDRFHAAEALHQRYHGVCVLKGAGSLVRSAQRTAVCTAGNPGMGTGGMGDVLTGIVAGLRAQGLDAQAAAELGVCLHASAADRAARHGERGLLATDLFAPLPALLNP